MPKRKTVPAKKDPTTSMSNAFNNDGVELPNQSVPVVTAQKAVAKATPNKSTTKKAATPKAKSPKRKAGKSSDPDFSKLTLYVKTDTVTEVKKRLLGTGQDASELAEKLFSDWLKKKS